MTSRSYLIVGHGGQGVLDLGNFLCYDAMLHGQRTAYTPSYGPETRGGKVRCYVVTSDEDIDSPIVDHPDVLVAMNNPSMDFEAVLKPKGVLLMNQSLIDRKPIRQDLEIIGVPATDIADKMKSEGFRLSDTRVLQNAVAYGAVLASLGLLFDREIVDSVLEHIYTGNKSRFIPANMSAIQHGYDFVVKNRNTRTSPVRQSPPFS
jgi:2-oxoglutarate ferredoxin oxidoreductase subunit gamma